ncbi:MAG: NAD(P)/FAD-dependent oxidoreductase [Dermatophilaceae bacterium]
MLRRSRAGQLLRQPRRPDRRRRGVGVGRLPVNRGRSGHLVDVLVVGAGQAGLSTGRALQRVGLRFLILEAAEQPGGSWPRYYDSLTLFSPARFSALPGLPLPGDPGRYPTRDEITAYLRDYAARFDLPVRTGARVVDVGWDDGSFTVTLASGDQMTARALIGASGGFGRPVMPALPGAPEYTGRLLHAADYRRPEPYLGQRVVVVGAGNTAVQVAVDLAGVAEVTLATRRPLALAPQRPLGVDVHYWTRWTGLETLPLGRRGTTTPRVLDDGRYAAALAAGRPDRRAMFTRLTAQGVQWADGTLEDVDVVILATGYRPDMDYLDRTAALDPAGWPVHCRGVSLTVPHVGYVGLPGQTGFASATVRGVGADAHRVVQRLTRALRSDTPTPATCRVPALAGR